MNIQKSQINIAAKIVSVVFAIILWFHVTTNATFSYKVTLPIQYAGPSENYIVASNKPDEILASIKGSGKELFTFFLLGLIQPHKRYAIVNLTGLPTGKNKITINKSDIILGMFTEFQVESILYPDNATFSLEIDRQSERTVAVDTGSLSGFRVKEGYCITGKPDVKPEFVLLQGPENIINALNTVKVAPLKGKNISQKDTVLKASLDIPQFVTVDTDEVEIHFHVEPLITREVTGIPLTLKDFPERKRPGFTPDTLTVYVHGPESLVSTVEPDNIRITVEYQKYRDSLAAGDSLITPSVTVPKGITVSRIIPRVLRFSAL